MANTLRFKRGLVAGIPTGVAGEPLFTTDTFDLYIGNGTTNTRFQQYIASGTTLQYLRGDGSLATFPTNIVTGTGVSGQVAYWSGTNTQTGSNNLFWDATNNRLGIGTNAPTTPLDILGTLGSFRVFGSGAEVSFTRDANNSISATGGTSAQLQIRASNNLQFWTGSTLTERMRLTAAGRLLLGTTTEGTQRLQVAGDVKFDADAATNGFYWDNTNKRLGIGTNAPSGKIEIAGTSNLRFFSATDTTADVSMGFISANSRNTAIDELAKIDFRKGSIYYSGEIAFSTANDMAVGALTERMRINRNGSVGIGTTSLTGYGLRVSKNITGSIISYGIYNDGQVQSDVTNSVRLYTSRLNIVDSVFTIPNVYHLLVEQGTIGASSTVTNQYGLVVGSLTKGTNNYGFYGDIPSGTGRWNLYMNGTAANYVNGTLLVGTATVGVYKLDVVGSARYSGTASEMHRVTSSIAGGVVSIIEATNASGIALLQLNKTGAGVWNLESGRVGSAFTLYESGFTTRLMINAGGNVLINSTTDSGEKLQVTGTMKVTGASTFGGNMAVDTNTFFVDSVNNRVGVGTVTPTQTFEVTGNQRITSGFFEFFGGVVYPQISRNNTTGGFILNTSGTVSLSNSLFSVRNNSGSDYLTIFGSGAATFSSSVTAASLNVTGASTFGGNLGGGNQRVANFRNSGGNGYIELQSSGAGAVALWTASGNEFAIYQNATAGTIGTNVFHITSTANVGISTFTPAYKLDVNGTFGATGAATFSSTLTTGGNILIGATASTIGAINFIKTGTSPVASRLTFGTDGTGYSFAIGKNQAGTVTDLFSIFDSGAATFSSSIQASTAIAIGTTPDTDKPFKILKNINATVGINFENTSTSSLAFSAIQMGTDVTGGTAFTNLVYGSSGITEAGAYKPSGTSLVNTGAGGLNFLAVSQPIRFFTSSGNGTLRASITNDGDFTQFNGTNPASSTTDAFRMYSADVVAGNAAPHFRTENGAVIKLYQETTGVGNAIFSAGGGTGVLDDSTFDGYTLRQIVKALRNQGILA